GVATIVLGLGLVVGAFAGRARWLIVPAVATSVAAVLAAAIGFAGVEIAHRNSDHTVFIQPGATVAGQYHSGVGDFHLVLTDHPTDVVTSIDVGIGDLTVDVPDDAHVQIDARVGLGSIDALGGSRNGYRRVLSIDDQKDRVHTIRLTLRVGVGSIEVRRGEVFQNLPIIQMPTTLETLPGVPPLQYFGDGSVQFQDGSIDFGDGRRIEADGTYQIPIVEQRADGSVQLDNGAVVRTDGTVVTPGGFVIARRPVEPAATTAPATATPTTTGVQP
ncbi:MAG: LiaF domain-containing protein, partial [Ilumatobacteraceae bacterium]